MLDYNETEPGLFDAGEEKTFAESLFYADLTGQKPSLFMDKLGQAKERLVNMIPDRLKELSDIWDAGIKSDDSMDAWGDWAFRTEPEPDNPETQTAYNYRYQQLMQKHQEAQEALKKVPARMALDVPNAALNLAAQFGPSLVAPFKDAVRGALGLHAGAIQEEMPEPGKSGKFSFVAPVAGAVQEYMRHLRNVSVGEIYQTLSTMEDDQGNKFDDNLIRPIAKAGGFVSAAVEMWSFIPGVGGLGSKITDKAIIQPIVKKAAQWATINMATNPVVKKMVNNVGVKLLWKANRGAIEEGIIEEGLQEIVGIGAVEYAKELSNHFNATGFDHATAKEVFDQVMDAAVDGYMGMFVLSLPGAGMRTGFDVVEKRRHEKIRQQVKDTIDSLRSVSMDKIIDANGLGEEGQKVLFDSLVKERDQIIEKAGGRENVYEYLTGMGWNGVEIPKNVAAGVRSWLKNEDALPFRTTIDEDVDECLKYKGKPQGTEFYRDSGLAPFVANETPLEALRFFALLSLTSANSNPHTNMSKTIKVWQKYKAGIDPVEAASGSGFSDTVEKVREVLTSNDPMVVFKVVTNALGIESGSIKTNRYVQTLKLATIDPQALYEFALSVNDFRMNQYYTGRDDVPNMYLNDRMTRRINEVRDRLREKDDRYFWTTDRVQSALWNSIKDRRVAEGLDPEDSGNVTYRQSTYRRTAEHFGVKIKDVTPEMASAYVRLHLIPDGATARIFDHYALHEATGGDTVIEYLDPKKQGTGYRGREWTEQIDPGKDRPLIVHVYRHMTQPERPLRNQQRYRSVVVNSGNIYNVEGGDPDGRFTKVSGQEKIDPKIIGDIERKLMEDGYLGYTSDNVTVFFNPVKAYPMRGFQYNISPSVGEEKLATLKADTSPDAQESYQYLLKFKQLENAGKHEEMEALALQDAERILSHPMFDILRLNGAEGRYMMETEFSMNGFAEVADLDIFLWKLAEYLKLRRQDSGYASQVFPVEMQDIKVRPNGIPDSQAPSFVFNFDKPLNDAQRVRVYELLTSVGLSGSRWDGDNLVVDHLKIAPKVVNGKTTRVYELKEKQFTDRVYKLAWLLQESGTQNSLIAADLPKFQYTWFWAKHHILTGENYDNYIQKGREREKELNLNWGIRNVSRGEIEVPQEIREREFLYKSPRPKGVPQVENQRIREDKAKLESEVLNTPPTLALEPEYYGLEEGQPLYLINEGHRKVIFSGYHHSGSLDVLDKGETRTVQKEDLTRYNKKTWKTFLDKTSKNLDKQFNPADEFARPGKLDALTIENVINPILGKLRNPPDVHVIDTFSDLPEDVLWEQILNNRTKGAALYVPMGDMQQARVFLIADRLPTIKWAKRAFFHEVLAHWGIRQFLGKSEEYSDLMAEIYYAKQEEVDKLSQLYGYDVSNEKQRTLATEEWFAAQMEEMKWDKKSELRNWVTKIVAMIRKAANAIGLDWGITDREIELAMVRSAEAVRTGNRFWGMDTRNIPGVQSVIGDILDSRNPVEMMIPEEEMQRIATIPSAKTRIRQLTGQVKVGDILVTETDAMQAAFKKAEQAARKAYIEGRKAGEDAMHHKDVQHYIELRQKRQEHAQERSYLVKTLKYLKKVQAWAKTMPDEERIPIEEALSVIDLTSTGISQKKAMQLAKTKMWLEDNPDSELPEYVMNDLSRLDKTTLKEMTIDDVQSLETAIQHYVHLAKQKNIIKTKRGEEERSRAIQTMLTEMKPMDVLADNVVRTQQGALDKARDKAEAVKRLFTLMSDHYDVVIESLGGMDGVLYDVLYRQVKEGVLTELTYKQNAFRKFVEDLGDFRERFGVKDVQKWLDENRFTVEVKNRNGQARKMEISRGRLLSLYRHSLNEDNRAAITKGGFGIREAENPNEVFIMTDDQLDSMLADLTPDEMAFAGNPVTNLFKTQADLLVKTFIEKNGYRPEMEQMYYPKHTMPMEYGGQAEGKESIIKQMQQKTARVGVHKGFMIERVGAKKPIFLDSIEKDIARSVHESAAYIGLEVPLSNASKVLYDKNIFMPELVARYKMDTWEVIDKALHDIAGAHQTYDLFGDTLVKLRTNLTTAILGLNPWSMLKQLAGFSLFMTYVEPHYLLQAAAKFSMHPVEMQARHESYSPQFLERIKGGFSRDVGEVYRLANGARELWGGGKSLKEKFMGGLQFFDKVSIIPGMEAAVYKVLDEFEKGELSPIVKSALGLGENVDISKISPEDKMRLAYRFADFTVERTQPMFNPEHRSTLSRGGPWIKMLTMFGDATNAMWNTMHSTYLYGKKTGEWSHFAKSLVTVCLINTAWVMFVNELRNQFRGKDEDEDWKDYVLKFFTEVAGSIYFVRDIVQSAVSKFDVNFPVTRLMTDISKSIGYTTQAVFAPNAYQRKEKTLKAVETSARTISEIFGIPFDPVYKTGKALIGRAQDISN